MPKKTKTFLIEIIGTIIGAMIMSLSTSLFLLPNQLSSGGFSGIATILYYKLNIPMGITIVCLNVPMFLTAKYKMGKKFFIKSLIGTISISIFIDILDNFQPITNDKILASIYRWNSNRNRDSYSIKISLINRRI